MKRIIIAAIGLLPLVGCGGTPDCGDDRALELVKEIAHREAMSLMDESALPEGFELYFDFQYVTQAMYNENNDSYGCRAQLLFKSNQPGAQVVSYDIEYVIEPSARGSGEFVITLAGFP